MDQNIHRIVKFEIKNLKKEFKIGWISLKEGKFKGFASRRINQIEIRIERGD